MNPLKKIESFDSGSNYRFGEKLDKTRPPRSLFDLSHLNTMTIENAGLLIPISLWETIPGDDFDISVDALLRVMPQVVPMYSRQRLYVYGFYSRYSDLWNNWQVFIDRGYTGNVAKVIPILKNGENCHSAEGSDREVEPNSLEDYLGLPIGIEHNTYFGASSNAGISCLPWMMYLRIYRDYFMNKNEWINDRVILPDDDSRFRVDDDGELLSAKDASKKFYFCDNNGVYSNFYDLDVNGNNYYMGILYHDYPDDYFTSALPFTQRGTAPTINAHIDPTQLGIDFTGAFGDYTASSAQQYKGEVIYSGSGPVSQAMRLRAGYTSGGNPTNYSDEMLETFNNGVKITGNTLDVGIALEQVRELAIKQLELEKMAKTDGSYAQFGLSFFGEVSKAAYDFRPTYIGGTYKNIVFTEVLQTAGSTVPTTAESGNSPLGTFAGHGITGITKGRIGHIHCDDFGMIMLIACIMPDVYYSQGLDRILTDSLESDKYKPERARLGMQPILNKELYYAGNNGNDSGEDNYLWAYQNPFDYLRYLPNKIHGKIADTSNKSFFPYTQSRKFDSLPNWGRNFTEAKDVRKDYLFAKTESAYSAQFSMNIRAVRPIPYKGQPAQILN